METAKGILGIIIAFAVLALLAYCHDDYTQDMLEKGYEQGYEEGHYEGYAEGYRSGYWDALDGVEPEYE